MLRITHILAMVLALAMLTVIAPNAGAAQGQRDEAPARANQPQNPGKDNNGGNGRPDMVRVMVTHTMNGKAKGHQEMRAHGNVLRTMERLPITVMEVPRQALRGLANSPHVVSVIEDIPEPPALDTSLGVINATDVHDLAWTGAGTTVAILDTGIDSDHEFFTGRIVAERCFSTPSGSEESLCEANGANSADVDTEPNCFDISANICDHGVHVTGITAGAQTGGAPANGVAPDANIIAIQVFTRVNDADDCDPSPAPCVRSYPSDQIAALEEVLDLHNNNPAWGVIAANMSLGGGNWNTNCDSDADSSGRAEPIEDLLAAGVATTIAAGNDGFLAAVGRPACVSAAVAVGNTQDDDSIAGSSNRGVLLDLFAPGSSVSSSVDDNGYGFKGGTSMAAPHVAGALAVLRTAYPDRSIGDLINDLEATGEPISYPSGGSSVTTPRIDLLAALQEPNEAPVVTVDDYPVEVDEGEIATNSGTAADDDDMGAIVSIDASAGTATLDGDGNWSWELQTLDGPAESQTVTITVTDDKGESTDVEFELIVNNVDPTVEIDPTSATEIDEGQYATIAATFTDPGSLDTHTPSWDWGTPADYPGVEGAVSFIQDDVFPTQPSSGSATAGYAYGDNGTFTVTATITDKDGGEGDALVDVTVSNVAPTADIDLTGSQLWNGMDIFFGSTDDPIEMSAGSTDPGSDDLTLTWDYGDGSGSSMMDLVAPPDPDPAPSPTVDPRDVTDMVEHLYEMACAYTVDFSATDDDGGESPTSSAQIIVVGTGDTIRGHGYWQHQYRGNGKTDFDDDELDCLLSIVNIMSAVFAEERPLGSIADAVDVLWLKGNRGNARKIFDAHLLTLWLNLANGSVALDDMVDTDGDGIADMSAADLLIAAEAARTNPATAKAALLDYKDMIETLNESR